MTRARKAPRIDPDDPTALLVVRAWRENGSASPLRVHVRQTLDVGHGFESTLTLADVEQACTALRGFLEEFLAREQADSEKG